MLVGAEGTVGVIVVMFVVGVGHGQGQQGEGQGEQQTTHGRLRERVGRLGYVITTFLRAASLRGAGFMLR